MSWVQDELAALERANLLRNPRTLESAQEPEVTIDGRRVVLLCSNNYLGLAADARVRAAAAGAARKWGAGSGASRLVSGTTSLHRELEEALAQHEQTEDAVLFSSGYLANLGVITTLTGPEDTVFSDELNHASIVDACRLSKARVVIYRHADVDHLAHLLQHTTTRRRVVVTDTVFSMDGDLAPVAELSELCDRADHRATLVTDDAHATGVIEAHELRGGRVVVVGTLSKALGSAGGYIATTSALAKLLRNRARTHVFDTASAPPAVAAAREALRIVQAEPWRRERVCKLALRIATELRRLGYEAGDPAAAVVPVIIGDARDALVLADRLLDDGVFCPAIRPPSVPEGTSRLRVTVMATHTDEHIDRALDAFARARGGDERARRPKSDRDPLEAIRAAGGVFVTGTDTGVGKTIVTASIASCLASAGLRTAIYKPVQTGSVDGADDAAFAAQLSGCAGSTGVVLSEPLAPSVAARFADTSIDTDRLVEEATDLRAANDAVVVEGAGGLLVPIDGTYTMADLARELGLPLVVVARPGLGTLNHTALTIEAARSRGLDVLGVIVSGFPSRPPLAERTNPAELERQCGTKLIGVLPALERLDVERGSVPVAFEPADWLSPGLAGRFDRDEFLATLKVTVSQKALLG